MCVSNHRFVHVKAVPKMTVPVSTKTVKKINPQRERGSAGGARSGGASGKTSRQPEEKTGRRVTTERTGSRRSNSRPGSRVSGQRAERRNGRSITIGNTMDTEGTVEPLEGPMDDYEEWQ